MPDLARDDECIGARSGSIGLSVDYSDCGRPAESHAWNLYAAAPQNGRN